MAGNQYTKAYEYGKDILDIPGMGTGTKVGAVLGTTSTDAAAAAAINKFVSTQTDDFFATETSLKNFIDKAQIPVTDKASDTTYQVVIAYLGIKYCLSQLSLSATAPNIDNAKKYLQAIGILLQHLATKLALKTSGGKRKQKGGMDTAKIYNSQGLVQELSALNQNDTPSPALLFPSPFSAGVAASSGAVDTLPADTVQALMPDLPIPGGGKKKVKRSKSKTTKH